MNRDSNAKYACLNYFHRILKDPQSVPPWSEWWKEHDAIVASEFRRFEYLRLKHRRLAGVRDLLIELGELPVKFSPSYSLISGTCPACGERTEVPNEFRGGWLTCANCRLSVDYIVSGFWDGVKRGEEAR